MTMAAKWTVGRVEEVVRHQGWVAESFGMTAGVTAYHDSLVVACPGKREKSHQHSCSYVTYENRDTCRLVSHSHSGLKQQVTTKHFIHKIGITDKSGTRLKTPLVICKRIKVLNMVIFIYSRCKSDT